MAFTSCFFKRRQTLMYDTPTNAQKAEIADLEGLFNGIRTLLQGKGSRRAAIALTTLETAQMWANKAIVKGDAND